jgi:hypothetical protein
MRLELNLSAADAFHEPANADRHCTEGIARTGCRLDKQESSTEYKFWFLPEDASKHYKLSRYQVVESLSTLSAQLWAFHTSGMSHMRPE